MARQVRVDNDRPGLIECEDCGHRFGARARQKGHTVAGSAYTKWVLDDEHLRCES
jgi:hypothetical protein